MLAYSFRGHPLMYNNGHDLNQEQAMVVALRRLAAVHVDGADAAEFLHNQFSADIKGLNPGESVFACYCEPRGRVLALILVCRTDTGFYLILSARLAEGIVKRLGMYVLRAKVVIGPPLIDSLLGLHRGDQTGSGSYLLRPCSVPSSNTRIALYRGALPGPYDQAAEDAWKMSELRKGISWMCPETSGQFLPQMLGFDSLGAVNFRKGCYPGQEIVARTHYLGKVKRHPRLLCTSAVICPDPMDKLDIFSGETGYEAVIVDCGHLADGGNCLLTVTRMAPDLGVDRIEYRGQTCPLF